MQSKVTAILIPFSGVKNLQNLEVKILENPHVNRSASESGDLSGTFYDYLLENRTGT